ncbi:TPA: hypothetical protein ACT1U1_001019 [Raoultella ornithinolytica]
MKDHEIRELVNQLRDIAIEYHAAGQLREQIARVIRAAMLQAGNSPLWVGVDWAKGCEPGNSPVIPDGYVMVPKVPSQAHLNSIAMRYRHDFYLLNDAQKDNALATARQMYEECSGQGFYTLPAAKQESKP